MKQKQWADIANILAGRTDNALKNHWNSSMRKRLSEFEKEFESKVRKACHERNLEFMGFRQPENMPEKQARVLNEMIDSYQKNSVE